MTGTTATTLRREEVGTIRTMVVCDDRDVMRLGLVEMLQTTKTKWATELTGFTSLPTAWAYLAGSSATSAIAILGGTSAGGELAATGRPTRPATRIVLMLHDSEAAHLAVAAGLPVDGFFLEEDLSVSMLRALLTRLDAREFPMPAPMDGATNKTIADELGISIHGVKHHVASLLKQPPRRLQA